MKKNNVLFPLIRKILPNVIAQDIAGVQPMTGPTGNVFKMNWGSVGFKPFVIVENQNECALYSGNHIAVDVKPKVSEWIQEQSPDLWKWAEETEDCHISFTRYIIDEKLFTMMSLKWGE